MLTLQSIFPTIFGNNWYITCYILFYLIFPYLNIIINNLSQKDHISIVLGSLTVYFGIGFGLVFIRPGLFFPSILIYWTIIYFTIAYIHKYKMEWFSSKKNLILLLSIGLILMVGIDIFVEFIGLHSAYFRSRVGCWHQANSPFTLITAIALFGLARRPNWLSPKINYIASLTFLIYIIHENILFRLLLRPYIYVFIKNNFGYRHIVAWVIVVGLVIFLGALVISILYNQTLQRKVHEFSDHLYTAATYHFNILLEKII